MFLPRQKADNQTSSFHLQSRFRSPFDSHSAKMNCCEEVCEPRGVHALMGVVRSQLVEYRARVLPKGVSKLAVEAGVTRGWRDYVGDSGDIIGLDRFGASAPGAVVMEKLGLQCRTRCGAGYGAGDRGGGSSQRDAAAPETNRRTEEFRSS